jgi:uncharacterized protein (TIGR02996 family)
MVTHRDFGCLSCHTIEYRRSDAADYVRWRSRWEPTYADEVAEAHRLTGPGSMPPTAEELFERIVARPHDDGLRLAYANVVERRSPERAEFIRLQIERFYDEASRGVPRGQPGSREIELNTRHYLEWTQYIRPFARAFRSDAPYQGVTFDRGFVAQIRTEPDMFADMGEQLVRMAPIEHLSLTTNGPFIDALTSPTLGRMRTLRFNALGFGDDEAVALAEHGYLDRCDLLDLSGNRIGARGLAALLANPVVRAMRVVCLYSNPCDPHGEVIQEAGGGMTSLGLPANGEDAEKRYGRIGWLHIPVLGGTAPDPYHVSTFRATWRPAWLRLTGWREH